jgi:hypothetical protein
MRKYSAKRLRRPFPIYSIPQNLGKYDAFAKQNDGGAVKSDFRGSCRVCSHGLYATTRQLHYTMKQKYLLARVFLRSRQ